MSAPALPPLPHDLQHPPRDSKPPLPPLPANFHPEKPLAAPTPERLMPSLPADMARTLDESANGYRLSASPAQDYRRPSPAPQPLPPGAGYPGGFVQPAYGPPRTGPSPAPVAYGSAYSSPPNGSHYAYPSPPTNSNGASYASPPLPHHHPHQQSLPPPHQQPLPPHQQPPPTRNNHYSLPAAMSSLSISHPPPRSSSAQPYSPTSSAINNPQLPSRGTPDLTARIPSLDSLTAAQRLLPPHPNPDFLPWIRDVLFLVDRVVAQNSPGGQAPQGAVTLSDPNLSRLANDAIAALLILFAPSAPPPPPEAFYIRASLYSTGAFPAQFPPSPRDAFRDFETAARAGFQKAWFKLGRDYEGVGDVTRARDCFERGVRGGVETCFYRMGMAHLLGQLGLSPSPPEALPLLHRAATLASIESPQPAYVYGLLLLGEFNHVRLDDRAFASLIPPGSSPQLEARKYIERAAYLGFSPAQYKLGHAYEYAVPPFPFDPLLSVQYYSLASQQGEPEADMALSKWFLCGAEGAFDKDEALAWTFADKAARKGLASAEFAMGYYAEVGVGGRKDVDAARRWYAKAVEHGNADAPDRLAALSQPTPQALSRSEHDALTNATLVRKRTQARVSATAEGRVAQPAGHGAGAGVVGRIQAQAQAQQPHAHAASAHPPRTSSYGGGMPPQQQGSPPPPHPNQAPYSGHAPRYSLSDGPNAGGGGGPTSSPRPSGGSPPGGRPAGRPPGRRPHTGSPDQTHGLPSNPGPGGAPAPTQSPALPPPTKPANAGPGPATFAEMGFQSGKAEDKDCVVM